LKLYKWLLIGFGCTFIILAFFMVVPVIIMNLSWWWFFIPFIFFIFAWIVVGVILLVTRLRKKPPEKIKINLKDAKQRAIYEIKYDEDNPDNFKIKWHKLWKVGNDKDGRIPVVEFNGSGTELNNKRVVIVNLNNPKHEMTKLIDPSREEVIRACIDISDFKPEESIKEETTIGMDNFGRPITTTKTTRPSQIEKKEQEEKTKAEEVNAM